MTSDNRDSNYILITGASRGIGKGSAQALAAAGFNLILWARTEQQLKELADECRQHGVDVRVAPVDISDPDSVQAVGVPSLDGIQALRGVVVNAGTATWNQLCDISY